MPAEIDKLEIAIETKTQDVSDKLDGLINKLNGLSGALGGLKSNDLTRAYSQLRALSKIDLSNLSKGVNIDIKFDGASQVQTEALAVEKSLSKIWDSAKEEADRFLAKYHITGKKIREETARVFENQALASFGKRSFNASEIDDLYNSIVSKATMTMGEFNEVTKGELTANESEWQEFINYVNKHKIKYITDVKEIANYTESLGHGSSLTNVFSKTGGIDLDTGYEQLRSMFPNILGDIENIGDRTEHIIQKILEARNITQKWSIADLGEGADSAVFDDLGRSVERTISNVKRNVELVKSQIQSDKIFVDIAVNEEKILTDIKDAVNRASTLQYEPVNIKLKVDTTQLKNDIVGQFKGIDLSNVQTINDALKQLNVTIASIGKIQSEANFSRITKFLKGIADVNIDGQKVDGISKLGTALLSMSGALQNAAGFDKLSEIVKQLRKFKNIDPTIITGIADPLSKLGKSLVQLGSSASAVDPNNIAETIKALGKIGNKGISNAISVMPQFADAIEQMLTKIANAPTIDQSKIDALQQIANIQWNNIGRSGGQFSSSSGGFSGGARSFGNIISGISNALGGAGKAAISAGKSLGSGIGSIYGQFGKIGSTVLSTGKSLYSYSKSAISAARSSTNLINAAAKLYAKFFVLRRLFGFFKDAFTSSMDYVESYHYFEVAYDKIGEESKNQFAQYGYESAEAYADSFSKRALELNEKMSGFRINESGYAQSTGEKSLGLDSDMLLQYQAQFAQMADSIGMTGEAASATSKALTMLAADWSSLRNIDLETSYQKMTSALAGQSRAVRTLGIDITQAALAETAANIGMTTSISKMGQVEKAELRMITMLQQSRVAWGDMAKTLNTPANQLRMLAQNFKALARTMGNLFLPVIAKILPYINGLVIALQRLFQWIANLLGIDVGKMVESAGGLDDALGDFGEDFSDPMEGLEDATDDAKDALEDAEEEAKELQKTILGFDELNILNPPEKEEEESEEPGGGGADLGLSDSPFSEQDLLDSALLKLLDEYEKAWQEAFEKMASAAHDFADKIAEIGKRIWDFIKSKDYEGLGGYLAEGVNWILQKLYDLLDPERFKDLVYPVIDAFTETFNSLVDHIDWGLLGSVIGRGINDLGYALLRAIQGIDWAGLGMALAKALNGLVDEIDWPMIGQLLAAKFMSLWDFLRGFLETLDGKQIGESIANMLNSAMDFIDWAVIGDTLALGLNKAFDILDAFVDTFHWDDLANNLSEGINHFIEGVEWARHGQVLGKLIDNLFHTFFKCVAQIRWDELAIGVVNGLTMFIASIHWEQRASELAAAINGILNGIYTAITSFDFLWAGSQLGAALRTLFDEVDWGMLGYNLMGAINGVLLYVQGVISTPGFFESLGTAFADFINGALDVGALDTATDLLIEAFNGVVTSLRTSLEKIDWDGLKRQLVFNINKLIRKIDLQEASETLKFFFQKVIDVLWFVAENTHWDELGEKIKNALINIPWLSLITEAAAAILKIVGGLWEGLGNDFGGLIIKGIVLFEVAKKLMPFVNAISEFLTGSPLVGVKLGNAGKSLLGQALSEGAQKAAPLVSANLAPVIDAVNGAFTFAGAISGIVLLAEEFDKLGDKIQGGNGKITEYGMVVDEVIDALAPKLGEHRDEIFKVKEELENMHAPAEEFGAALKQGLEDAGISQQEAEEIINRVRDGMSLTNDQLSILDGALTGYKEHIKEYKDEITFDEVEVSVEEFCELLSDNLGEIVTMLGGTEQDFNRLSTVVGQLYSSSNAQEVFDSFKTELENLGIPVDGLIKVVGENFPDAIKTGMSEAGSAAEEGASGIADPLNSALDDVEQNAVEKMGNVSDSVAEVGEKTEDANKNLNPFEQLISALATGVSTATESMKIGAVSGAIKEVAERSGDSEGKLRKLSEEIDKYAEDDSLIEHTEEISTALQNAGADIEVFADALADQFQEANIAITPEIAEILAQIDDAAKETREKAVELGESLPDGATDGVENKKKGFLDAIAGLFTSGIDTAKDTNDSHSPSRVYSGIGQDIDLGLKQGIEESKREPLDEIKELATEMQEGFRDIAQSIPDAFSNIASEIASNFNGVEQEIRYAIGDMYWLGRDLASSFGDGFSSQHITLPHIEWSWDRITYGNGGWVEIPNFFLNWYAKGGFPSIGELFVANENGPEMVGQMGKKNVVANNMQIIEGIKQGFMEAMFEVAVASNDGDETPYQMNINLIMPDGEVLARQVEKGNMRRQDRFAYSF